MEDSQPVTFTKEEVHKAANRHFVGGIFTGLAIAGLIVITIYLHNPKAKRIFHALVR